MQQLPFSAQPAFTQEVTLDAVPFRLATAWNGRANAYSLSFRDRDGNSLVEGIRLVPDYELILQFPGRGLPPGQLYLTDPKGLDDVINRADVPNVIEPVYVTEAEVEELAEAEE
jgi:hypothetical protein